VASGGSPEARRLLTWIPTISSIFAGILTFLASGGKSRAAPVLVQCSHAGPIEPEQSPWSEIEKKLLRLALCQAAQPGEVDNAGRALIQSLRKRKVRAEALLSGAAPQVRRAGDLRMPFGKHKGLPLHRIEPGYLLWILDNVKHLSPRLEQAILEVLSSKN
jgi:hypothetical protein